MDLKYIYILLFVESLWLYQGFKQTIETRIVSPKLAPEVNIEALKSLMRFDSICLQIGRFPWWIKFTLPGQTEDPLLVTWTVQTDTRTDIMIFTPLCHTEQCLTQCSCEIFPTLYGFMWPCYVTRREPGSLQTVCDLHEAGSLFKLVYNVSLISKGHDQSKRLTETGCLSDKTVSSLNEVIWIFWHTDDHLSRFKTVYSTDSADGNFRAFITETIVIEIKEASLLSSW